MKEAHQQLFVVDAEARAQGRCYQGSIDHNNGVVTAKLLTTTCIVSPCHYHDSKSGKAKIMLSAFEACTIHQLTSNINTLLTLVRVNVAVNPQMHSYCTCTRTLWTQRSLPTARYAVTIRPITALFTA